jgi:MFS family permease
LERKISFRSAPNLSGLLRDLFAPQEMGKAWAIFGPVMGLSAMLGPVLSGLVIGADLLGTGWRMICLINLPIGAFVLIAGARHLPGRDRTQAAPRLDLGGAAIAGVAVFLLVFPLVQGRELRWPLWTLLMAAAAVPVLALFAVHQLRRKRAGAAPLVEPSIFENASYISGTSCTSAW